PASPLIATVRTILNPGPAGVLAFRLAPADRLLHTFGVFCRFVGVRWGRIVATKRSSVDGSNAQTSRSLAGGGVGCRARGCCRNARQSGGRSGLSSMAGGTVAAGAKHGHLAQDLGGGDRRG